MRETTLSSEAEKEWDRTECTEGETQGKKKEGDGEARFPFISGEGGTREKGKVGSEPIAVRKGAQEKRGAIVLKEGKGLIRLMPRGGGNHRPSGVIWDGRRVRRPPFTEGEASKKD